MSFTIDQIEQACGLLLLTEFKTFVYYCKWCQCEFESGYNLEVHILSEHQDNKEAVFVNENVFVDNFELSVGIGSTVKDEQPDTNANESSVPSVKVSNEADDDTPLADSLQNHDVSINGPSKTKTESQTAEKQRVQQFGSKNKKSMSSKSTKKSTEEMKSIPKEIVGRSNVTEKSVCPKNESPIEIPRFRRSRTHILYCDMCPGQEFNGKTILKQHMRINHILQKWCTICNIRTKRSYERHMKRCHPDQDHKCHICNSTFKYLHNLEAHKFIHTKEKPFKFLCEQCGKSFQYRGSLNSHVDVIHNNIKKYKCPHCDNSFRAPNQLRDHINGLHTKERPHQCDICMKGFANINTLRKHKLTHGEKELKCRHCDRMFKIPSNRRKHERIIHNSAAKKS